MRIPTRRIAVSLALAPLALVLTEGALQTLKLHQIGAPRSDVVEADYMPTRIRPGFSGELSGFYLSTNAQGFREVDPVPLSAAAGEYRILVLGDSVGMGFGVEPEAAFPRRLEAILNAERGHPTRVINTSGQGYSPSNYLVYLRHEGLRFEPDLVLVQIELCNDLTDEALLHWGAVDAGGLPETIRGGRYVVSWDGNLLGTVAFGPSWFEKTYTYTMLLRQTLRLAQRITPRAPFDGRGGIPYYHFDWERFVLTEARLERGFSRLFDALQGLSRLLQPRGIPLVVAVLPSRYMFEDSGGYTSLSVELYRRALGEAGRRGLAVESLAPTLEGAGGVERFLDFAHPDPDGHEAVAEALASALLPQLP